MTKKKAEANIKKEKRLKPEKLVSITRNENLHFIIGLLCVIVGVYMLVAFTSFLFTGGNDQSILQHSDSGELIQTNNHIQNYAGARGAQLSQFLINDCFGIPACLIIVFLIVSGMKLMKAFQIKLWKWFFCCFIPMIWLSVTLGFAFGGLMQNSFIYPGGMHGYNISRWICSQIGAPGLILGLLATAIVFGLFVSPRTILIIRKLFHIRFPERKTEPVKEEESPKGTRPFQTPSPDFSENTEDISEETISEVPEKSPFETPITPSSQPEDIKEVRAIREPDFIIEDTKVEDDEIKQGTLVQPYNPRLDLEYYKFPTLDLLNHYSNETPYIDNQEQEANKNRITQVLHNFGVEINTIKASVGPTVTLYEITPAEGIRISKIRNLENDIALSLSALGIRIIAPIPGKGTIGIEVPNTNPHIVPMYSVLANKKFQETNFELPIALGKTITNEVFMVDLTKAPHMLVAGATGQGKSVGLNAIVTSLLYKKHPSELKFVIIDPKKVEFAIYAPIEKHFLAKLPDSEDAIITDVTKVVQTLNSLCVEMDTRYDLLQQAGCRNIREYNDKFIKRQLNPEKGHRFMPYIVIIIDEFGDLIMTAGKEVELPICRIAQLARAVGIHAIIATQRPTTNIITGTIKANFPARLAFRVASMTDSRTILDRPGAQQLIGKGDLLYLQGNDPVRVQCAFVDTPEVERIAEYIGSQQGYPTAFMLPEYVDSNTDSGNTAEVDMNRLDPLFEEAARLIIYHQQGSTSLIQRKFSIGYNRAGRIMDQLERAGIVGPANGSKARDVYCIDDNDLEMRLNNLKE